jgi:hypothetical protein
LEAEYAGRLSVLATGLSIQAADFGHVVTRINSHPLTLGAMNAYNAWKNEPGVRLCQGGRLVAAADADAHDSEQDHGERAELGFGDGLVEEELRPEQVQT